MSVAEVLLRGLTAGVMLAVSIGFVAADHAALRATRPARWSGALFCLSVAAFAVHSGGAETDALGIIRAPVWLLSAGGIGYFWLFAITLFEDRRFGWVRVWPIVTLTLMAAIARALPDAASNGVWIVYYLLASALALHIPWAAAHSWGGDLVEAVGRSTVPSSRWLPSTESCCRARR